LILKEIRTLPVKNFTGLLNPPNTPLSVASMKERGCPERALPPYFENL
jgi:hypothetical protein